MNINLTSGELSGLWTTYMNDSMSLVFFKYYSQKNEDDEIQPIIDYAMSISEEHLNIITELFHKDKHPLPNGFSDQDVHLDAARLFSDVFVLVYIHAMSRLALHSYALLLSNTARNDIRNFFSDSITQTVKLYNDSTTLMLSKGIYRRPPIISPANGSSLINSTEYISGWLGDRRTLNAIELTEIYFNIQRNSLAKALFIGFSQVAENEQVKKHMIKGKEIAAKHIEVLNSILNEEDLFSSLTWDLEITRSTDNTFSDRVMIFHMNVISALGAAYYGISASASMRKDLGVHYERLVAETLKYGRNGAKIAIENNWFEEPPQAPNRDELADY